MFLEGKSPAHIARHLTVLGIPTPGGKPNWRPNTVESILTNEKYKGDAILQKTFCTDFLTKKMKVNEGEVPQYYVEGSHPAIISPEMFDAVQAELKRRKGRRNYTPHCFSGRIYCEECGAVYGSKVWNSTGKYKSLVWQCNKKHRGHTACKTPALRNDTIEDAFVRAVNQIIDRKETIIQICEGTLLERYDVSALTETRSALRAELEILAELMQRHISANARVVLDQAEYQRQYDEYESRFLEIQRRMADIEAEREAMTARRGQIMVYLEALRAQILVKHFDEALCYGTVEQVRVSANGSIRFVFKDGQEVEIK